MIAIRWLVCMCKYVCIDFQNFVSLFGNIVFVHSIFLVHYKIDLFISISYYYSKNYNKNSFTMSQLLLYIPYIRNNITRSILTYYFRNENIGEIVRAQMYSKINNNETYYIALIQINLYNTLRAKEFYTKLHLEGGYRFIYDEEAEYYWLVKLYNKQHASQKNMDDVTPVNGLNVPLDYVTRSNYIMSDNMPMNISIKFHDYLYDAISFENMAREINTTIRNYTYELYGM